MPLRLPVVLVAITKRLQANYGPTPTTPNLLARVWAAGGSPS
jgi:hypothetical protein